MTDTHVIEGYAGDPDRSSALSRCWANETVAPFGDQPAARFLRASSSSSSSSPSSSSWQSWGLWVGMGLVLLLLLGFGGAWLIGKQKQSSLGLPLDAP